MSVFLENKGNLLHLGQLVIVAGVTFYYNKKFKALTHNINELHKMILQQGEQIEKQNKIIENLIFQNNQRQMFQPVYRPESSFHEEIKKQKKEVKREIVETSTPPKVVPTTEKIFNSTLIFKVPKESPKSLPIVEIMEDEPKKEEFTEDDLDQELEDELKELEDDK
jgi:hypothetical protein